MNTRPILASWLLVLLALCQTAAAQTPAPLPRQAAIDDLVTANHILANEGVLDGYGHVSIRDPANPQHYLLARAGAPALVTAADITEYDLDSKAISVSASAGYQERFIHGEIYKARPDVVAVIHCHCLDVIAFAATGVTLKPMYHMGYFLGEGAPVFDIRRAAGITNMLIETPALGQALAQSLGKSSVTLLRGHGAAVVAGSLHQAVGKAYYLNINARQQLQALQLGGKIAYLLPDEAAKAEQNYERSWDFWKSRLPLLR